PVLASAVNLARRFQAALVLFHGITVPHETPPEAFDVTPDRFLEILEERARAELDAQVKTLAADIEVRVMVHTGVPWQAICEAAKAQNVDLIVIGSHGFSGLDHILGTTA